MDTTDKGRLNALTIKYLLGTLSEDEQQELDLILNEDPVRRQRFEQRVDKDRLRQGLKVYLQSGRDRTRSGIRRIGGSQNARGYNLVRRYLPYAAAILLIVAAAIFWMNRRQARQEQATPILVMEHEVQPGSNRATLTLDDGSVIDLNAAGKGAISQQGGTRVFKTDSGRIVYKAGGATGGASSGSLAYNIVTTPRGGTYRVELPDGSIAWLNAASRIRFPAAFPADRRDVEMSGEVYFEIAANASKPFYVHSTGAAVKVLGTEFDIQDYRNEPSSQVTLLKGAVKVTANKQDHVLSPGQQARLTADNAIDIIDHADIEQAIAWKTGFFKFKNADIRSIMREIERWYDVDVSYEITDYSERYGGRISRNLPLSGLLRLLQGNKIHHYKMEGRNLIVLP